MIFATPTAADRFAPQLPVDKIKAEHMNCFNGTASEGDYITCAQQFLNIQAYSEMRNVLKLLLDRFPDSIDGWNALGVLEHQCENFEAAVTALKKSIKLEPKNDKAKNNLKSSQLSLANALRESRDFEAAIKIYQEISDNDPSDIYILHNIATISHMQLSQFEAAIKTLKKVIQQQPAEPHAWLSLANCYMDMHDSENMARLEHKSKKYKIAHDAVATLQAVLQFQVDPDFKMSQIDDLPLIQDETFKAFQANNIFREFVEKLSNFKQNNLAAYKREEELPPCNFMGDSHVLSAAHLPLNIGGTTYRATPYLHGGKLFNLVQPCRYRSKHLLETWASKLDKDAPLIINYGEIDCRAEGGYLSHFEKNPDTDQDAFMREHIQAYMKLVKDVCPQKEIYIASTPPLSPTNAEEHANLIPVIELFNRILKEEAGKAGLGYINLYDTLVTEKGAGEEGAHIDRIHLAPLAYQKAVEKSTS